MPFLTFSDADIRFIEKKLVWRSYITVEALPNTKNVEFINRKDFAAIALEKNKETFVVHVAILLTAPKIEIYLSWIAQITLLLVDKAFIKVFSKYSNYVNIFLSKAVA